jgi:hypothetical protein
MAFLHGKSGKVTIGGTTVPVKSWKAKVHKDEADVTNTTSSGWREFQTGLKHVEFTVEAEWDSTNNPFGNTEGNIDSVDTIAMALYTDSAGSANITIAAAIIFESDIDLSVENVVKYTVTGKSSGSVTFA